MIRLISSQVAWPTSPVQISFVPGRNAKRKGLRNPYAITRRAFGSLLPNRGLSGSAAPVMGSTRMIVPSSVVGSEGVRRSWTRSAPPSAVGGVIEPPTPPGGSPHGLTTGFPNWPQSSGLAASPAPTYSAPSGPNVTVPIEWVGLCWHQSSMKTCSGPVITSPDAVNRERRAAAGQPSGDAPGGSGQGSDSTPGVPYFGAAPPMSPSYV